MKHPRQEFLASISLVHSRLIDLSSPFEVVVYYLLIGGDDWF